MTNPASHVSLLTMIASPILWVLLFAGSYTVTGLGCNVSDGALLSTPRNVRVTLWGAAALTATLILLLGIREESRRRAAVARCRAHPDEAHARVPMLLHLVGVFLSVAALIGTLWLALNTAISPLCNDTNA